MHTICLKTNIINELHYDSTTNRKEVFRSSQAELKQVSVLLKLSVFKSMPGANEFR